MDKKRNESQEWIANINNQLVGAIEFLFKVYSDGEMRKMSKAQIDAIFVGILRSGTDKNPIMVRKKFRNFYCFKN